VPEDQAGAVSAWHRDRLFGLLPQDGVYCRPNVIVSMTYLQEQTRSVGPLRILPGSHLLVGAIGPEGKHQPAPGEVLLTTQPGDCILLHGNLLHSGTSNVSGDDRVMFFIELERRLVWLGRVTAHPTSEWTTQQVRNLTMALAERATRITLLVRDRDAKFVSSFDTAFKADGVRIVKTPVRAPRANAYAERWVRSVRAECLDWILIWNRRHLERVLSAYVDHYNRARPHRGIDLEIPAAPDKAPPRTGPIERVDVLGGLIHEYHRAA
jgi:hypothetical protein